MYVKEMRYLKLRAVSVDIMFSAAIGNLGSANKRELGNAHDELILAMLILLKSSIEKVTNISQHTILDAGRILFIAATVEVEA